MHTSAQKKVYGAPWHCGTRLKLLLIQLTLALNPSDANSLGHTFFPFSLDLILLNMCHPGLEFQMRFKVEEVGPTHV